MENRARFWIEVLEAVKAEVGDECAVAVRIAADALGPAGVPVSETIDFMRMPDDHVDLWDLNVGSLIQSQKDSGPSRFYGEGYQLDWTRKLREATKKLRRGDCRLRDGIALGDGRPAEAGIIAVYRVGDCVAPRLLADAVFEGHRLAREIDEADPSVPLPYRRELGRPLHLAPTS